MVRCRVCYSLAFRATHFVLFNSESFLYVILEPAQNEHSIYMWAAVISAVLDSHYTGQQVSGGNQDHADDQDHA